MLFLLACSPLASQVRPTGQEGHSDRPAPRSWARAGQVYDHGARTAEDEAGRRHCSPQDIQGGAPEGGFGELYTRRPSTLEGAAAAAAGTTRRRASSRRATARRLSKEPHTTRGEISFEAVAAAVRRRAWGGGRAVGGVGRQRRQRRQRRERRQRRRGAAATASAAVATALLDKPGSGRGRGCPPQGHLPFQPTKAWPAAKHGPHSLPQHREPSRGGGGGGGRNDTLRSHDGGHFGGDGATS